jgi:probable F420-dependent oxidoreductase
MTGSCASAASSNPAEGTGTAAVKSRLGRLGAWMSSSSPVPPELAAEAERLGFGAMWLGNADGNLALAEQLLTASSRLIVATGIVNIWAHPPGLVAAAWHRVEQAHPGRLLLGLGVGHREAVGPAYARPYRALTEYLDALDQAGVPADRRVLAALGPQVLRLAAKRAAGAHPYLVTPEYTRTARAILGNRSLLAPEQKVVLDPDPDRARALARRTIPMYLGIANYAANLDRLGYTEADLAAPGSDRLIDDLVAHGTADEVARRLQQHLAAGADHVTVQVLNGDGASPLSALGALGRRLADWPPDVASGVPTGEEGISQHPGTVRSLPATGNAWLTGQSGREDKALFTYHPVGILLRASGCAAHHLLADLRNTRWLLCKGTYPLRASGTTSSSGPAPPVACWPTG